jgi:hypothetical protein
MDGAIVIFRDHRGVVAADRPQRVQALYDRVVVERDDLARVRPDVDEHTT